jgi:hypothetical protein
MAAATLDDNFGGALSALSRPMDVHAASAQHNAATAVALFDKFRMFRSFDGTSLEKFGLIIKTPCPPL